MQMAQRLGRGYAWKEMGQHAFGTHYYNAQKAFEAHSLDSGPFQLVPPIGNSFLPPPPMAHCFALALSSCAQMCCMGWCILLQRVFPADALTAAPMNWAAWHTLLLMAGPMIGGPCMLEHLSTALRRLPVDEAATSCRLLLRQLRRVDTPGDVVSLFFLLRQALLVGHSAGLSHSTSSL
jgi:hypothetical protein